MDISPFDPPPPVSSRISHTLSVRPLRLHIADGDDGARERLVRELEEGGHIVTVSRDGEAMMRELVHMAIRPEDKPDAVVMHVDLPSFSGLEIFSTMREAGWELPVVLLTTRNDDLVYREAERLGAIAVFRVPFDVDDLATALCNLVDLDARGSRRPAPPRAHESGVRLLEDLTSPPSVASR